MQNHLDTHDFRNFTNSITTDAAANYIEIELQVHESTGKISLGEIRIIPDTVESTANPGIVKFAQSS